MTAKTIDEVIARLEGIIKECIATRKRILAQGEFKLAVPSQASSTAKAG